MKIAILGCGPAGLLAAHAVFRSVWYSDEVATVTMTVLSRKMPSQLFGAQYLHSAIPGLELPKPVRVLYQLRGDADAYRRKVYGRMWDGKVSPEDYTTPHYAWDIRAAYEQLWAEYNHIIHDVEVQPSSMPGLIDNHDLVINTIPRDRLCTKDHAFGSTEVWAAGDAPALGIKVPEIPCPTNSVVCNGEEHPSWYRVSNIYGHRTIEWPGVLKDVPVRTASRVRKPTYTDCDCWPEVLHVGRYGKWEKGVLSHHAYEEVAFYVGRLLDGTSTAHS